MIEKIAYEIIFETMKIVSERIFLSSKKEKDSYVFAIKKLTQSPIYDPETTVKYALIKQVPKGKCYPKINYFYKRLINEETILDESISNSSKDFKDIFMSIRSVNTSLIQYIENLNDEQCLDTVDIEDEIIRLNIDLYRCFVATLALKGLSTRSKKHKSLIIRLQRIVEITKYSFDYTSNLQSTID